MTFITKGNKLFYAACVAYLVSRMGTSGTYISRYLNIRTCDFRPLSVQLRCRANIFPTLLPRPWFRISPIGAVNPKRLIFVRVYLANRLEYQPLIGKWVRDEMVKRCNTYFLHRWIVLKQQRKSRLNQAATSAFHGQSVLIKYVLSVE